MTDKNTDAEMYKKREHLALFFCSYTSFWIFTPYIVAYLYRLAIFVYSNKCGFAS